MEKYLTENSDENSRTNTLEGLTLSGHNLDYFHSHFSESSSFEKNEYIGKPQLIAIIGDEDTCVGFLLAGIGQINEDMSENFIVVDHNMDASTLELMFLDILERPDIGLVLITREAADLISFIINQHNGINPTVVIIPGHNGPFDIDLPIAVKIIEERRQSISSGNNGSRRGSSSSGSSVKGNESSLLAAMANKKLSTHSIRSILSTKSLK